jgi:hypothetical protein
MRAYKRAALYLHGLSDADKSWMLGNIPSIHSERLEELLDSLRRLGIPRDCTLFSNIDAMEINGSIMDEKDGHLDMAIQVIDEARADEIIELLEYEPLELVNALLEFREWSWKTSFLDLIDSGEYDILVKLTKSSSEEINERVVNLIIKKLYQKMKGQELCSYKIETIDQFYSFESEVA